MKKAAKFIRRYLAWVIWVLISFPSSPSFAAHAIVPNQVGGFVLGAPIEKYKDRVDMSTRMNVRYREFLSEVEINPMKEFKSGLIAVGNCADPGKIVRIKLKYADQSKEFFNELLKRFKARLGPPSEYQGDPFRVFIVWKWSLFDENHNQINVILQHNIQDEDEKIGNAVKMTFMDQLDKERACFQEKKRQADEPQKDKEHKNKPKLIMDWELLIPK